MELFNKDKRVGLVESVGEFYAEAKGLRCIVHLYRNLLTVLSKARCVRLPRCSRQSTPGRAASEFSRKQFMSRVDSVRCS